MTRMSDLRSTRSRVARDNGAKMLARASLARRVQRFSKAVLFSGLVTLAALVLVGCIIPPSLSVERQDAGQNSPPGILKVVVDTTTITEAQVVTFTRTSAGTQGTLVLTLIDTDLDDTLHARVFVNYSVANPTPPRSTCDAPPNNMPIRDPITCPIIALCQDSDVQSGMAQDMTVVVFDRAVDDSIPPVFQYDGPDGLSASNYFHMKCVAGT